MSLPHTYPLPQRRHRSWPGRFAPVLIAMSASACFAQDAARSDPLFEELARMDHELFDAAFVSCNASQFRALFTDDAEFYHDRTGASVGEAARTLKSCPRDNGVTRTLVTGSLEVYPMQGYGAIQMGRHVFARKGEPGSEEAKFVHLWKRENGAWRLARVLSFDHRPSAPEKKQD
ncbi:nuclear transport factor 2 family protein [Paucibacter sp. AS339]|uniref:nuclear transport factor 2 family protein n=1 Tax=Paucibacter hankyongi TaxID=3133434 RepID=UPI0030A2EF80